jgi:sigma-54-specific transcriptional regulator
VLTLRTSSDRRIAPSIRATALVFEDPSSRALRSELERIAPTDASAVIIGETGTGKELVARFLHEHSKRAHRPFIAVNCGALVDSLIEAELFGYEKGAFTGAAHSQIGWFEAADGGTLFLDEIGDLPLNLQVKLLRVLQEKEVVHLGARHPIPVNFRIIAATNVDLGEAVAAGRFREDLFFRLNVAAVRLPPLRERPGDILPLVSHFIGIYARQLSRPELPLSAQAEAAILAHAWPGNIRELENVIHFALLVAGGQEINLPDLRLTNAGRLHPRAHAGLEEELTDLIRHYLQSGEQHLFDRVVQHTVRTAFETLEENQIHAADALGITRNVLRTYLSRMGVIAPRRAH